MLHARARRESSPTTELSAELDGRQRSGGVEKCSSIASRQAPRARLDGDLSGTGLKCLRAAPPFPVHPHMLRHGCGYVLANAGHDTRVLQAWLGHKNIQHTVRYTELAPDRFKDF
jgi:integrase